MLGRLIFILLWAAGLGAGARANDKIQEIFIEDYPDEVFEHVISGDKKHIATVHEVQDSLQVYWDGKPQTVYDEIQGMTFSDKGDHLAYAASKEGRWIAVLDGADIVGFDKIDENTFRFFPEINKWTYFAEKEKKTVFVINDEVVFQTADPEEEIFGYDENDDHIAFVAKRGDKQAVYFEGKFGQEYEDISNVVIDTDPLMIGYVATRGGHQFAVIDGVEKASYQSISDLKIKGSHWRCLAEPLDYPGKNVVVIDGKPGPLFDWVDPEEFNLEESVQVSEYGEHHAYIIRRGEKYFVVYDGRESPELDEAIELYLLHNGSDLHEAHASYIAVLGGKSYWGCDDFLIDSDEKSKDRPEQKEPEEAIEQAAPEQDAKEQIKNQWSLIIYGDAKFNAFGDFPKPEKNNGEEDPFWDWKATFAGTSTPAFSEGTWKPPESYSVKTQHTVCLVEEGKKQLLIDGVATEKFDEFDLISNPEDEMLVWFAKRKESGKEKFYMGVNNFLGKGYDKITYYYQHDRRGLAILPEHQIVYYAIESGKLFRVTQSAP